MGISRRSKLSALFAAIVLVELVVLNSLMENRELGMDPPADEWLTAARKDDRVAVTQRPGDLHESVGEINVTGCTITHTGDGVAISAAHCFDDIISGKTTFGRYVTFHCDESIDANCDHGEVDAKITEIALPAGYHPAQNRKLQNESRGYDIAFVRMVPLRESPLPPAHFSLADRIETLNVSLAGYNGDKLGLTGESSCMIHPSAGTGGLSPYDITTNCYTMPGSSGAPLLDENNRMIGVHSSSSHSDGSVSYDTPITPGLKAAFEKFRNGALEGEKTELNTGVGPSLEVTRFSYERTPPSFLRKGIEIPSDPCC